MEEGEKTLTAILDVNLSGMEPLIKKIEDLENKNFRKILDYMLDPDEDDLNPAYSEESRLTAETVKKWRDEQCLNLLYKDRNQELRGIEDLSDYVRDYPDIIKDIEEDGEFGEKLNYRGIELVARKIRVGGLQNYLDRKE